MIPEVELTLMKNFVDAHFNSNVLNGVYFISPAGKEIYKVKSRINIIWFGGIKLDNSSEPFDISFHLGSSENMHSMGALITLPKNLKYNSYLGAYEWQIPDDIPGINYNHFFYISIRFKLANGEYFDRYTQFFKIEP
jgi:hypothetical protein